MFYNKKFWTLNTENTAWFKELKLALIRKEEFIPIMVNIVATNYVLKLWMLLAKEDQPIE